jgi:hypothetical protein
MNVSVSERFRREGEIIGQLIVGYGEIELELCRCIAAGNDDLNRTFRSMFGQRSEGKRIEFANTEGVQSYTMLRNQEIMGAFNEAIKATRFCLQIRNRYAHWLFYNDDTHGMLAVVNVEKLAKSTEVINDLLGVEVKHLTENILQSQQTYFIYTRACIEYVNCEGRFLRGNLKNRVFERPKKLERPLEFYSRT